NELNIGRPLFSLRPARQVPSASLGKSVQINRFGTFAQNRQNGFVVLGFCFMAASSRAHRPPGRKARPGIKFLRNWQRWAAGLTFRGLIAGAAVAFAVTWIKQSESLIPSGPHPRQVRRARADRGAAVGDG